MFAYLNSSHSGAKGDSNAMGKDLLALTTESHLPPVVQSALFAAAASPGRSARRTTPRWRIPS